MTPSVLFKLPQPSHSPLLSRLEPCNQSEQHENDGCNEYATAVRICLTLLLTYEWLQELFNRIDTVENL
jgi:hypothetical protein